MLIDRKRQQCMGKSKNKARKLQVALSAPLFYEKSQEKKPELLEKHKKRFAQEWKNGEIKRFHGMYPTRGWGLRNILFQAKLTAIAINLKRIEAITRENSPTFTIICHILENPFKNSILKNKLTESVIF